jgi:hypothetical protein
MHRDWPATLREARTILIPAEEARSLLSDMTAVLDSSLDFADLGPRDLFEILENIRPLFETDTDHLKVRLFLALWDRYKCAALVLLRGLSSDLLSFGNRQLLECLRTVHLAPLPAAESQPNFALPDDDEDAFATGSITYIDPTRID